MKQIEYGRVESDMSRHTGALLHGEFQGSGFDDKCWRSTGRIRKE